MIIIILVWKDLGVHIQILGFLDRVVALPPFSNPGSRAARQWASCLEDLAMILRKLFYVNLRRSCAVE